MLEKAKNQKNFLFFVFIILGFSLFISPVFATDTTYTYTSLYKSGTIRLDDTSSDFSYLRSFSSGDYVGTSTIVCRLTTTSTPLWQYFQRGYIAFNTASLPDGDYIKYINLTFPSASTNTNTLGSNGISIVNFNPDNIGSVTTSDFNNFEYTSLGNGSAASIWSLGTISLDKDLTKISRSGYTKLGIISQEDLADDESGLSFTASKNYNFQWGTSGWSLAITITDEPPYDADITVTPASGETPLAVTFTDASTGFTEDKNALYLDFGDGESYSGTYPGYGATRPHIYYGDGVYNYSYRLEADGEYYYSNGSVTVGSVSETNYDVIVSGLDTHVISGANVSIWYNGEYKDSEDTDGTYGTASFNIPPYRFVNGTVTKSGYQTAYFDTYIYPSNNFELVTLYADNETPGSGDSYGNYIVTFKNANTGNMVEYSNIEVYSDSGYTTLFYDEYSNNVGVWTGLIPMDVVYYYKYPETIGYYEYKWSYNLTSSPAYKIVNLVPKSGATSTPTPTPTSITTTITPTVTYTLNTGNLSTLNVKERFTNLLVLAGFQNAESADLIFAMIIVLGCTALIGWITLSGSGAGMGAIIGFVFSLGLGLIPLWLLIAAIFFGCLYVALKLFGGSGE